MRACLFPSSVCRGGAGCAQAAVAPLLAEVVAAMAAPLGPGADARARAELPPELVAELFPAPAAADPGAAVEAMAVDHDDDNDNDDAMDTAVAVEPYAIGAAHTDDEGPAFEDPPSGDDGDGGPGWD